ncbi:MAG: PQQ-binding-like beta-propeller repeat protein [Planctomycetaceae bacterium]|nr:PQQ-binding-like beta-propeller repeat protein [Planctomycetaceae bacterium]
MQTRRFALRLLLLLASGPIASGADWSQFRGDGTAGYSSDAGLPTTWSAGDNIRWRTELPGYGASCPIVVGDRIYLTCWTGYGLDEANPGEKGDLKLHVVALDKSSGELIWNQSRPASPNEQDFGRRLGEHGYASPTPCSDGERVYAYFGVNGLVAYDQDGNLLWEADCGSKTAGFGCAASPILYKNLVIQNGSIESGTVYAFDKLTGELVWKDETITKAWTTPTIAELSDGTAELIVNQQDFIYGFNPLTGEKLWTCAGIDDYVVPSVVVHDDIAYCFGGRQNRAIAVRLGGRGDVTESHKLWEQKIGANVTSPVYHDGKLYCANDKGAALCLDAATGETLTQERLPARGRIYASIVYGDGKLYVTTRDTGVVVLAATPEYQELATNVIADDPHLFNSSPAISDGKLYYRTNGWLYCIGK